MAPEKPTATDLHRAYHRLIASANAMAATAHDDTPLPLGLGPTKARAEFAEARKTFENLLCSYDRDVSYAFLGYYSPDNMKAPNRG